MPQALILEKNEYDNTICNQNCIIVNNELDCILYSLIGITAEKHGSVHTIDDQGHISAHTDSDHTFHFQVVTTKNNGLDHATCDHIYITGKDGYAYHIFFTNKSEPWRTTNLIMRSMTKSASVWNMELTAIFIFKLEPRNNTDSTKQFVTKSTSHFKTDLSMIYILKLEPRRSTDMTTRPVTKYAPL